MIKTEIINDIKANGGAEAAALQLKFNIPYREVKAIIDELVEGGTLVFESGLKYSYVEKPDVGLLESEELSDDELHYRALQLIIERGTASVSLFQRTFPIGYLRSCELLDWMENNGYISAAEGIKPRRVLITQEELDELYEEPFPAEYDDDDEDFPEYEKFLERYLPNDGSGEEDGDDEEYDNIINRILHSDEYDDTPDGDSIERTEAVQSLAHVLSEISVKKKAPVTADKMPLHPSWDNEDEFTEAVTERMERLIKSDKRMGQRGAVRKAEACLETVRDTHDRKMVQVYERLVYEIKNTGSYLYGQLKKQFFGE